jgi:hypothetical protein
MDERGRSNPDECSEAIWREELATRYFVSFSFFSVLFALTFFLFDSCELFGRKNWPTMPSSLAKNSQSEYPARALDS